MNRPVEARPTQVGRDRGADRARPARSADQRHRARPQHRCRSGCRSDSVALLEALACRFRELGWKLERQLTGTAADLDREAAVTEDSDHPVVGRQDLGGERLDAGGRRRLREVAEQRRGKAMALQLVGDRERDLRPLGACPDVAGVTHDPLVGARDRDHSVCIAIVDFGGALRSRVEVDANREEAERPRVRRQAPQEQLQRRRVVRAHRPYVRSRPVAQDHVNRALSGVGCGAHPPATACSSILRSTVRGGRSSVIVKRPQPLSGETRTLRSLDTLHELERGMDRTDGTAEDRTNGRERRGTGGWEDVLASEAHLVAPGEEWRSSLWAVAAEQFNRAADLLSIEPETRSRLLEPRRALTVNFPVRRDNGDVEIFTGYRVQHTLALGPTKGGVRYAPGVSLGEWRRKGRRPLRSESSLQLRARAHHTPLRERDLPDHRTQQGHPSTRHGDR